MSYQQDVEDEIKNLREHLNRTEALLTAQRERNALEMKKLNEETEKQHAKALETLVSSHKDIEKQLKLKLQEHEALMLANQREAQLTGSLQATGVGLASYSLSSAMGGMAGIKALMIGGGALISPAALIPVAAGLAVVKVSPTLAKGGLYLYGKLTQPKAKQPNALSASNWPMGKGKSSPATWSKP